MSVITIPKPLRDVLGDEGADAFVKVLNEAGLDARKDLATKEDIGKLSERMTKIEAELVLIKWMLGFLVAGVISLIVKAFFVH